MAEVFAITGPIFILIGLGFLLGRAGLISLEQTKGLGTFVIYLALPALLFRALAQRQFSEILNWSYLGAYSLASVAVFAIGFFIARKIRREGLSASAILAMGMSVPNSGFIGYPIVFMVMGDTAALAMALGMLVENLLMVPLALALAEAGQQRGQGWVLVRETALRLARNPLIIAISLGLVMSILGWQLPSVPARVIDMLVAASAPVALFVIGASLSAQLGRGLWLDVLQTSSGKLVLHPLLLLGAFTLVGGLDTQMMAAGLLFAAAPVMTVYPILGQRYGMQQRCAAALVGNTVLAFFTINALLMLLHHQGWLS